jgi:putative ABC transport system permease protein
MLFNHLIIALRIIRRHKVHAAINILGLALAMAVSIIIMLYVQDDFRHEERHVNVDRTFRVYREYPDMGKLAKVALTSQPLAAALKDHLYGIEDAVTLTNPNSAWVRHGDQWLKIYPLHFTDPSFFRIFTVNVLSGTLAGALEDPRSAILTKTAAKKIYGSQNPVGKKLFVRSIGDFSVTAVIEDPQRTHLRLGVILPMDRYVFQLDLNPRWINNFTTYVLAGRYESEESVRSSVAKYAKIYEGPETKEVYRLQPLRRVWLHSDLAYDFLRAPYHAELDYVMLTVVLSILAMACFNYINIETARAGRRAAEVALRKALGADRRQLISQFLGEAWVLCLLALFLAVILVETVLPVFNRFVILKELKLFDPLNFNILLFLIGTALATGLAAGSYPALLLSAIKPAEVLKRINHRVAGATLRQIMVAAQFSVSILLILATLTLAAQLEYLCQKDPGYDPKNLVAARLTDAVAEKYDAFKADLLSHPNITAVTAARDLPNWRGPSIILRDWEGRQGEPDFLIYHGSVDRDFIETMRIELLEGISFAGDESGGKGLIVNQAAVEAMGMSDPLGSYMAGWSHEGQIIGVVKNYFYNNMRESLEPLVLKVSLDNIRFFFARISSENAEESLAFIERQWGKYEPELPVDLVFFEKIISGMYLTEEKLSKLFGWATLIAIWISCLGLYGLTTFIAVQRSKEIAIRKSYGASIGDILKMLTLQYLKIVLVANLVAWPVAYLAMNRWLATFEQHIGLNWTLFVLTAIISILVVLATVSYQALKTASANPVDALRYE